MFLHSQLMKTLDRTEQDTHTTESGGSGRGSGGALTFHGYFSTNEDNLAFYEVGR